MAGQTLNTKEEQDSAFNPEQVKAARELQEAEQRSAFDRDFEDPERLAKDGVSGDLSGGARSAEENGGWKTNVTPDSEYGGKQTEGGRVLSADNVRAILKKRGPLGLIITIGLGGGILGSLLFSPGIILVQMKEALVDRFNVQFASADARTTKLIDSKINNATKGLCGAVVSVGCKYASMSKEQAGLFQERGKITVIGDDVSGGKRIAPTAFEFEGKRIPASEFTAARKADPKLRNALRQAYNPKYAGFADKIWLKVAKKMGLTKQRSLPDGTDAEKTKAIADDTKNGRASLAIDDGVTCTDSGCTRKDGSALTDAEADEARAAKATASQTADEILDSADGATERSAAKSIGAVVGSVGETALKTVGSFIKVTGPVDTACQAYSAVRGLGYAAKTIRAFQLARYAMVFVNTADQIKAGTVKAEDVAYLGGILTSIAYDAASGAKRQAAMDSAGMKYALYGDSSGFRGKSSTYISQFMAGGGLTGDLIAITSYINQFATVNGVGPRKTCSVLNNGWVQLGSAAVGIVLMLIPGVNVAVTAVDIAKAAASVAVSVGLAILPDLLRDIVAGNITNGLVGEDSGNGIASGFGVIGSGVSQYGGNGTMTTADGVGYLSLQNQTIARYAADEQSTLSPLDASSKNTFLGSIVNKLLPYSDQMSSLSGSLSALASIVGGAFGGLIPKSSAITTEQYNEALTVCNDPDYEGIATDPFCNVIFGIPPQYLDRDPTEVANQLAASGQINIVSGTVTPGSDYAGIVKDCIDAVQPIGSGGPDGTGDDGSKCTINDQNANYYLYYVDQRIDTAMNGYGSAEVAGDDKQALAQQIMASPNISYDNSDNPDASIQDQIATIADGTSDGNTAPCQVNIAILQMVASIAQSHTITISDINRDCVNSNLKTLKSPHWTGNAIDISRMDGTSTSDKAVTTAILDIATQFMPAGSMIGIVAECNPGIGPVYKDFQVFDDPGSCGHLHIGLPIGSDPGYK